MTPNIWADSLVARIDEDVRVQLAADPASAMSLHFGLTVSESTTLSKRGNGGWCDGLSFRRHNQVLYAPSPYSKRKYFTMLHEFGHVLTDDEDDENVLDWLGELDNERELIERVCDLVAGRLLVPDRLVDEVLDEGRPIGESLRRLHTSSNASREACAVALSRRLGCPGFVSVIKDDVVTFTARLGEPIPAPWKDVQVPRGHPLRTMTDGDIQARESWWPDYAGSRHHYYQHALRVGSWTYAVFAKNDLWGLARFHAPRQEERAAYGDRVDFQCANCGLKRRTRTFRCSSCGSRACPQCEYCSTCDPKANLRRRMCKTCTQTVLPHLLDENGNCPNCR